jgi:ribose transport system substrate-binding protein
MRVIEHSSRWSRSAVAALLLGAAIIGGCGGNGSSSSGSATAASTTTTGAAAALSGKGKTIGIIHFIQADEAATRQGKAVEEAAERFGWTTKVIDTNLDPSKAVAAFSTFVNAKVDGIVMVDLDTASLKAQIKQADDAGIPVISYAGGSWVPGLSLDVGINDQEAAAKVGVYFFDQLAKTHGTKAVDVIEMTFQAGNPCRAREPIFDALAAQHKNVKITKYNVDGANPVAAASDYMSSQINQKGKSLAGVIACWGLPAQGAVAAAKKAGRKDLVIVGMNGDTPEIDLIAAGDPNYRATVALAWASSGDDAIKWMDKVLAKKAELPSGGRIYVPSQLITKDTPPTASKYDIMLPDGWSPDYWRK